MSMIPFVLTGVILIFAVLVQFVPWKEWLRACFANNPNKGRVYILCGEDVVIVKAKRLYEADDGEAYGYRWGGMDLAVVLPPDYGFKYIEGRRAIAVVDGQTKASPFSIGEVRSEGVCDISAIVMGNVVVELVKELTSKGQSKWTWLIIGAVAAVACYLAYTMFMGGGEPPPVVPNGGEAFPPGG